MDPSSGSSSDPPTLDLDQSPHLIHRLTQRHEAIPYHQCCHYRWSSELMVDRILWKFQHHSGSCLSYAIYIPRATIAIVGPELKEDGTGTGWRTVMCFWRAWMTAHSSMAHLEPNTSVTGAVHV